MSSIPQVLLTSTDKWPDWLKAIRKTAESKNIWDYVDPDKTLEPTQQSPTPVDKPAGHDTEKGPSQWAITEWQYDRKIYDDKIEALAKLNLKIFKTVSETYHGYLIRDTVHQNLINLKSHVALSTSSYKIALRNEYRLLTKGPKGISISEWLARYE